jgi:hypothetical protein
MDDAERLAWLDELIERADSDAVRLRGLELSERIAERKRREWLPAPQPAPEEELSID